MSDNLTPVIVQNAPYEKEMCQVKYVHYQKHLRMPSVRHLACEDVSKGQY